MERTIAAGKAGLPGGLGVAAVGEETPLLGAETRSLPPLDGVSL